MAILSLLLSACAGTSTQPALEAQDIQSTAVVAAFTIVAETMAAIPTDTPLPPTNTPIPPTATLEASPTVAATFTSQPVASGPTADPCNKPLTAWQGPSASLNIVYDYSPQGKDDKVVVSLWVMTDAGECGFLSDLSYGPVGQYTAAAYVDGKKDFKVFGGFRITEAGWDIVIRNDKIIALGGCYPNC
jgi:hypothetical protein